MSRCQHSVYIPSWWTNKQTSPYCTGCTVMEKVETEDIGKLKVEWDRRLANSI